MPSNIAPEQIQSFRDNGYLIFRGLASLDEAQQLRRIAERELELCRPPLELEADVAYPGAPDSIDAPGGTTIRRLQGAFGRHVELASWGLDQRIASRLRQLFNYESILLVHNHHNCIMTKQPHHSSETHWHQDNRYWSYQESDLITAWLALGHEEQANGGMNLIPGTHRMDFADDRYDEALFLRENLPQNQTLSGQAGRA